MRTIIVIAAMILAQTGFSQVSKDSSSEEPAEASSGWRARKACRKFVKKHLEVGFNKNARFVYSNRRFDILQDSLEKIGIKSVRYYAMFLTDSVEMEKLHWGSRKIVSKGIFKPLIYYNISRSKDGTIICVLMGHNLSEAQVAAMEQESPKEEE